jgi:arylsulfatase A-like enzyme
MIDERTPDFASRLKEGPVEWGFDYSYIIPRGHMTFPYVFYENNVLVGDPSKLTTLKSGKVNGGLVTSDGPGDPTWDSSQTGRILTEKIIEFIDNHLSQNKKNGTDKPFLIHFNTDGAHGPFTPPETLFGKKLAGHTKITAHTDMVYEVDIIAGRLVNILKERDIYANTIIVITSDNGGIPSDRVTSRHDAVGDLRGFKSTIWEGGTRVPFIVHWGDDTETGSKIKPGIVTNQVIGTHDLAVTFAEIAGVEPGEEQALDSVSFLPVLFGKQSEDKPIRESLLIQSAPASDIQFPFTEFLEPLNNSQRPIADLLASNPAAMQSHTSHAKAAQDKGFDGIGHAVLKNNWKLFFGLQDEPQFLANLNDDPKEQTNLLEKSENKNRIEEYQAIYKSIRKSKRSTTPLKLAE